ncbi:MAG: bifunctional phosphopantothenoylcysteine decarboxylase/phosphopantothenate--cysteine ligase CoaBC [Ignavibacteria bacterium]|nr:bifunctional phosphopantothenoylcysteine decarboxylase/phosphopantothenate--cysteine ligase CoaBC [Ignavibacteria bacterium]MBI3765829.1 bifunctional phosphopantothenoylcysteine decarboxylase/phosphopantothenate--cysteine ligase CoaBC [Ignavibacteriales bacterium]
MLKDKNILIGVTGGIAAYKIPSLVRDFKQGGANVRVVMTESAREFVTPLTLSTLSGNEVILGTFPQASSNVMKAGTWHIDFGTWADIMVIAPATANVMAKLAHGYADNAVTTLALAVRCPIVISPAMDVDMWQHSATQENVSKLREMGYIILPPEEGELASGLSGPGRLPELSSIITAVNNVVSKVHKNLQGKRILVTAGPTHEAIDPVRYLGNRSSGKMGFAIANAAAQRGASVTLIAGNVRLQTPRNVHRIDVERADEMYDAVMKYRKKMDAVIMAAAVADFAPATTSSKKIKKETSRDGHLILPLKKTKDILGRLGEMKNGNVLVGFSLETHNELTNAKKKLREKNLDLVVLNNPTEEGAGFGADTNVVTIISKNGKIERLKTMSKFDVAERILDRVAIMLNRHHR